MTQNRLFGGILLVSGTTIGAGMLAMPVASSFGGFFPSFALLFFCWLFFFITAWLLLDVNLASPGEANLISMVGQRLGPLGKALCWVTYLLLLYSLTAAYIAGSAPIFLSAFSGFTGWTLPPWVGPFPLLFLFAIFVYLGTSAVDRLNRLLMALLIFAFLALISFLPAHVKPALLFHSDLSAVWIAVPVLFTSYGFHIVIPTLTTYLHHDRRQLRIAIFVGSFFAFIFYAIWQFLILGSIPSDLLALAWNQGETGVAPLRTLIANPWIGSIANLFSFSAILTSFLGVSLSLSDFLADGLKLKRYTWGREFACLLTFFPPLLFLHTYPHGFILALEYAGIFVAIVLCIIPALMAAQLPGYKSPSRRTLLLLVFLVSLSAIYLGVTRV
jgi:tyrosine-specific transport protein